MSLASEAERETNERIGSRCDIDRCNRSLAVTCDLEGDGEITCLTAVLFIKALIKVANHVTCDLTFKLCIKQDVLAFVLAEKYGRTDGKIQYFSLLPKPKPNTSATSFCSVGTEEIPFLTLEKTIGTHINMAATIGT